MPNANNDRAWCEFLDVLTGRTPLAIDIDYGRGFKIQRAAARRQAAHDAHRARFQQQALQKAWFNMYYGGRWS